MNQKKKNQAPTTNKKLNRVKSEDTLPIGSLMQEIGSLKEELRIIKQGKKEQPNSRIATSYVKENKQNKDAKTIQIIDVQCISRQTKLKIEIQINKLRRHILSHDQNRTAKSINEIFEVFNSQIKEIMNERNRFKLEIQEMVFIYETYRKEQEEKCNVMMRNNQKLQVQVDALRKQVERIVEQEERKEQEMRITRNEMKINQDKLLMENEELIKSNADLQGLIDEWELQCRALKEKCISYEKTLETKSQQMIFMEEDIKYLRLESQKFKSQKKEIEKLWEKSTLEAKETKKALQDELERLQREKNKWMNECSLRRQQSQQIQAIESHKSLLFKQIQDLRNSYTLKCKELADSKALLHEAQRKIITLQSDNYKMAQEIQKSKRKSTFWQQQIESLRNEVAELQSLHIQHSESKAKALMTSLDSSHKKVREEKLKALEDIHNLIRQQKHEIDQND